MLLNYFKVALRNFSKNKVHTFINIFGLAFGIASVFLITLYLKGELSYDRFHQGAENLYRITWQDDNPQTRTPHPMAQALASDFLEVESGVSLTPLYGSGLTKETHSFRNLEKDERFDETRILAVDTTFFDVFSFPLVRGDPRTALHHINGVLISESAAKKYFDDADPIGKQLAVDSDTTLVEVVAVFKDIPENSHFHFDFLVTYLREKYFDPEDEFYTWRDFGHFNYIRLTPGADPKKLEGKLMEWSKKYLDWSQDDYERLASSGYGFRVQPVTDIHLTSHLRWELESNGNMDYVYILAAAALLTLAIACVNFMNLTTAKSTERAKEIGIRKSLGAFRQQLAMQFISESVLISLSAVLLAVLLVEVSLPWFNSQTGASLEVSYVQYTVVLFCLGVFVGLASGIYPSLYLSSAKPIAILKGNFTQRGQGTALRDVLIAFQFAISMALISGSFIIFSQLDFLKGRNLGFNQEGVLVVPLKSEYLSERFEALRTELMKIHGVKAVSASSNIPGKQFNQNPISSVKYPQADLATSECLVDVDFFDVLGITLKEGRLFSRDHIADSSGTFILNETAANQLNLEEPVGSEINWDRDGSMLRAQVIGVVNDFHFQSLHEPMRPLLFTLSDRFNFLLVKTDLKDFSSQISAIEKVYRQFDPIFDFEFTFLDDQLQQQYLAEERLGKVIATFSVIAVVIACFGLFAMALLTFYQKIKEISVRKILGASLFNLLYLLLRNFTVLVIVSAVAATPVTWWIMDRWLENFSFRITVEPLVFILSGLTLIAVCWSTLGYLTVKTTKLNPAETLRRE